MSEYDYDLVRNYLNRFSKGKTIYPHQEAIMWGGLKLLGRIRRGT